MRRESVGHTLLVAFLLCVVCSTLVSGAAYLLKDRQAANVVIEVQKNILSAAGIYDEEKHNRSDVPELYEKHIVDLIVELDTGRIVEPSELGFESAVDFNQFKAASDPELSRKLTSEEDIAIIKHRENYSHVYRVKNTDGSLGKIVLPMRGYGLWSTLYGFISLDADGQTIRGLTFYDHKETPGLGGEVDNPKWKSQWSDPDETKYVYGPDGNVQIEVTKAGGVSNDPEKRKHQVDGLSGATITTRGVSYLLEFWLGPLGFKNYLEQVQSSETSGE